LWFLKGTTFFEKTSKNSLNERAPAVFALEFHTSDLHAALGRLLDQARVADLQLVDVNAHAKAGKYCIRASIDVSDRAIVDRLARLVSRIIGVAEIEVIDVADIASGECQRATPAPCTATP